jgi:hypothetical protein
MDRSRTNRIKEPTMSATLHNLMCVGRELLSAEHKARLDLLASSKDDEDAPLRYRQRCHEAEAHAARLLVHQLDKAPFCPDLAAVVRALAVIADTAGDADPDHSNAWADAAAVLAQTAGQVDVLATNRAEALAEREAA